jgi:hypothetical protein
VFLRFYEGLSAAEIASREKIPAGTVRWRLKEGLDRIRRRLDQRYGGERGRWLAAVAPLVSPRELAPPSSVGAAARGGGQRPGGARWMRLLLGGPAVVGAVLVLIFLAGAPQSDRRASPPSPAPGVEERAGGGWLPGARRNAPPRNAPPRFSLPAAPAPAAPTATPVALDADTLLRQLLGALEDGSYESFLTHASDEMKAYLDKSELERVSRELAPRLRRGYRAEPLGSIRQEGHTMYLWKIALGETDDDLLAQLWIKEGLVAAFLIR